MSAAARLSLSAGLTPRQREVLTYIVRHQAQHQSPPTVREIGDAFGFKSTNSTACHLRALAKAGCIQSPNGQARRVYITPTGFAAVDGKGYLGRALSAQQVAPRRAS